MQSEAAVFGRFVETAQNACVRVFDRRMIYLPHKLSPWVQGLGVDSWEQLSAIRVLSFKALEYRANVARN